MTKQIKICKYDDRYGENEVVGQWSAGEIPKSPIDLSLDRISDW